MSKKPVQLDENGKRKFGMRDCLAYAAGDLLSYTTQPALPIRLSPSPSEPLYIYLLIDLCLPPLEDMLMRAAFSLSAPFCLPVHHLEQCPTHSRHSINTC